MDLNGRGKVFKLLANAPEVLEPAFLKEKRYGDRQLFRQGSGHNPPLLRTIHPRLPFPSRQNAAAKTQQSTRHNNFLLSCGEKTPPVNTPHPSRRGIAPALAQFPPSPKKFSYFFSPIVKKFFNCNAIPMPVPPSQAAKTGRLVQKITTMTERPNNSGLLTPLSNLRNELSWRVATPVTQSLTTGGRTGPCPRSGSPHC